MVEARNEAGAGEIGGEGDQGEKARKLHPVMVEIVDHLDKPWNGRKCCGLLISQAFFVAVKVVGENPMTNVPRLKDFL